MASGVVSEWLRQPGDHVRMGDGLLVVETEKVESEIPAPRDGWVLELRAGRGDTVPVGGILAILEDREAEPGGPPAESRPATAGAAATEPPAPGIRACAAPCAAGSAPSGFVTPVVRALAAQHGIDLAAAGIRGSGHGGRVTKRDLLAWIEGRPAASRQADPEPRTSAGEPLREVPPAGDEAPGDAEVERVPLGTLRRRIAEHMRRSVDTAAHVTTVYEVDLTALDAAREARKEAFRRENGAPLTLTVLFLHALARALRRHPELNVSLEGDDAVFHRRIHVAVATALDRALVTPVIHDADRLSPAGLAARLHDLVTRARSGRLTLGDLQGGTFTLTNTGRTGAILGTPIISQPQVAILHAGALRDVVAVTGPGAFAVRKKAFLSLSFDHRWLDGADADRFLDTLRGLLEQTPWEEVIR